MARSQSVLVLGLHLLQKSLLVVVVVVGGWHSENNISSWSRSSDFELE